MSDEPDSYDIGTHMEPMETFARREDAERAREALIGLPRYPDRSWSSWNLWHSHDLEIEEVTVR